MIALMTVKSWRCIDPSLAMFLEQSRIFEPGDD